MLIIANWKCNPQTLAEAKGLFDSVEKGVRNLPGSDPGKIEVVVCPSFVYLSALSSLASAIKLGGQDCFFRGGPFTGEVSPAMLKDLGCQYVILGHSERRALGESDELINKKIKAVLEAGLSPIFCLGEKELEKEQVFKVLKAQLRAGLKTIPQKEIERAIFVYEPVWAISTSNGRAATPQEVRERVGYVRDILTEFFGAAKAQKVKILYGGSVEAKNAKTYIKEAKMDGVLVGAASLNAQEFVKLVKSVILE